MEVQQTTVEEFLRRTGGQLQEPFVEVISGKDERHRPQLGDALHLRKLTNAILLIAKLDRLSGMPNGKAL